jgi:hypothetical protein
VDLLWADAGAKLFISRLSVVETVSVFAKKHFQEADRLLQQYGLSHAVYTLDALQLAVALDLHRRGLLAEAVAADRVFLTLAVAEGLKVMNPETP